MLRSLNHFHARALCSASPGTSTRDQEGENGIVLPWEDPWWGVWDFRELCTFFLPDLPLHYLSFIQVDSGVEVLSPKMPFSSCVSTRSSQFDGTNCPLNPSLCAARNKRDQWKEYGWMSRQPLLITLGKQLIVGGIMYCLLCRAGVRMLSGLILPCGLCCVCLWNRSLQMAFASLSWQLDSY